MSKILSIIALLFSTSFISNAQHFGVKLGANYSGIGQKGLVNTFNGQSGTASYFGNATQIAGANIGIYANFGKDKIVVQPEVLYSMKGFKNGSKKYGFNYINVPILVGYKVAPEFTIMLGPEIGYLLNQANPYPLYFTDNFKSLDYGAVLAGTYHINEKIGINLRYNYGIANIYDVPYSDATTKNRTIQLSIQYQIK